MHFILSLQYFGAGEKGSGEFKTSFKVELGGWKPVVPATQTAPGYAFTIGARIFRWGLDPLTPFPFGSTTIEVLSPLSLNISATEYANNFWTPRTQAENHFKLSIFVNVI